MARRPLDVECPICRMLAGRFCARPDGTTLREVADDPDSAPRFHQERIDAAQPKQSAIERFAERFATQLEARAVSLEDEARKTRIDYPGEIGRVASGADQQMALTLRNVAQCLRAAAKEPS